MKHVFTLVVVFACCYGSYGFAFPSLTPYHHPSGISFYIPQGWQVDVNEEQGTVLILEDANDPNAASLGWFMASSSEGTPEEFMAYFVENTLSNPRVMSATPNNDGSYQALVQGQIDGIEAQVALLSFSDASSGLLSLLVFAATPARFDALGGADLLLVTFGGQSPDSLQASSSASHGSTQQGQAGVRQFYIQQNPECFDTNSDILYNSDYCQSIHILAYSLTAPALQGTWSEVTGASNAGFSGWRDTTNNTLSYDSSAMGMTLVFDNQGRYTLLYRSHSTSVGCSNSIEAIESGNYQFNADTLQIGFLNAQSEITLDNCGSPSRPFQGDTPPLQMMVGFGNNGEMVIDMPCRDYMGSSCPESGYSKLIMYRQ